MSLTSIDRVIVLPLTTGGANRYRADQPLTALLAQVSAASATFLCREGELRTLYEHPGNVSTYVDCEITDDSSRFTWNTEDDGALIVHHRVRLRAYGETAHRPVIEARWRWGVTGTGTNKGGAILSVVAPGDEPGGVGTYAVTTVNEAAATLPALIDGSVSLTLPDVGRRSAVRVNAVTTDAVPSVDPSEAGYMDMVDIWLGFWCVSADDKSPMKIHGLTIFSRAP